MSSITQNDLLIILKAGIKMAQQDSKIDGSEKELLSKIMELGQIDHTSFSDFDTPVVEDIESLSESLSSKKAKKLFLLTLATVALADDNLSGSELDYLKQLTEKLKIGRVKIDSISKDKCKEMVYKLIQEIQEEDDFDFSNQPTADDMDF